MSSDVFSKLYLITLLGLSLSALNTTENSSTVTSTVATTTFSKPIMPISIAPLIVDVGANKTIFLPNTSVTLTANVRENTSGKYEYEWEILSKPDTQNAGSLDGKNNKELQLNNLILGAYHFKVSVRNMEHNKSGEASLFVFVKPAIKKNEPPIAIIKPRFQVVQLPNNIILDGSGSSDDAQIVSYHWETVKSPIEMEKDIKDHLPMLELDKNIIAGNYTFKLTVKDSSGMTNFTTASLVVLPEKDYPPKADPGPNMIVNLPTNSAILNGSGSTDDKKIVSYEWSKISDSLTADIQGVREPILRLTNLQEGTYSFNLKVIDSAGQSSEKEVKVFVKPRLNVLPTAKASVTPDNQIIVRLPATEALLNGSLSSDDDKIIQYKWTQISGEPKLNIDSKDKPIAYVNDLKVGVFKFQLTVWDSDKQHSSDVVTLRVEESQNQYPKATILVENHNIYYLEPNFVKLDGSKSWDDHKIIKYHWSREDDSLAIGDILAKSNSESVLLLTGLLPGVYKFKLTVFDEEGLFNSEITNLNVLPSKLENYFVELQFICSIHNFTESKKNSFISNIQLIIQKKIDSDLSRVQINVVKMNSVTFTNCLSLVFYVTLHEKVLSSNPVITKPTVTKTAVSQGNVQSQVNIVKSIPKITKLDALAVLEALNEMRNDLLTLMYPVLRVETYVCQNNCSDHGKCNSITRLCECDTFWTNSLIRDRFGDRRPNCDWSIIYLIIFFCLLFLSLIIFIWIIIWIKKRKCKKPKTFKVRKHKYMRLSEYDSKNKLDPSMKFPKALTNGIKSRTISDKDLNNFDDTESNMSSEGEETMFINNRNNVTPMSMLPAPLNNGQAMKNL